MTVSHEMLVFLAKTVGLFYLIAMAVAVVAYACWPANRPRFDAAAKSVLDDEDSPL